MAAARYSGPRRVKDKSVGEKADCLIEELASINIGTTLTQRTIKRIVYARAHKGVDSGRVVRGVTARVICHGIQVDFTAMARQ
ncbi:hypothetical protein EVAR_70048_1 [Eumeta japonica]|uniref:Uncharacterized protein n=1 Tax=Eumeta variegata TaxID=151549 RepID=A0A4C2AC39_EUMVA|nr:hypothetical protein EVAR_70048_1 [Eumeta japonica]